MYAGESICFGISTPEVDVLARFVRVRRSESAALNPTGDLTNVQFPMLNSHLKWDVGLPNVLPHTCGRFPFRMRIENWELSIGQIPGPIHDVLPTPCAFSLYEVRLGASIIKDAYEMCGLG